MNKLIILTFKAVNHLANKLAPRWFTSYSDFKEIWYQNLNKDTRDKCIQYVNTCKTMLLLDHTFVQLSDNVNQQKL